MVTVAILIGSFLSVVAVAYGLKVMQARATREDGRGISRWPFRVAATIAVAAFPFAWWFGFIIGGNFGGAIGAAMSEGARMESGIITVGIAGGIFLVTTVIVMCLAGLAFILTRKFSRPDASQQVE